MATQTTSVYDTLSGTDTANVDLKMNHDGVVRFEFVRTAGSLTVFAEVSLDNGTTFVNAFDSNGIQVSVALDGTSTHRPFDTISSAGTIWRIRSTQGSSGTAQVKMTPILAP